MDYNVEEKSQNINKELNCKDCGALLLYAPGTQKLACKYCGAQNDITPEEKELYDAVTSYLTKKKEEASETKNIHVSLALTVMQRRLVSSIFAIKNTLGRRYNALKGILDETNKNPNLFSQRHKLEGFDVDNIEEFEDLEDDDFFEYFLRGVSAWEYFT